MIPNFDEFTSLNESTKYEPNPDMSQTFKLSELTYDVIADILKEKEFYMHTDASDCLRSVMNDACFNAVKELIMGKYGDIDICICNDPDVIWSRKVTIVDDKFGKDMDSFERRKQAWCDKYGCD